MAIKFIGKFPFITTSSRRIVPFDFYNNLFTPLGSSVIDWTQFIIDSKQNYAELLRAYNTLSEVASPYNYWAENSGKVKFKVFRTIGEDREEITNPNDPLVKLLNNPNKYMGWNEFKANNLIYFKLLGQSYLNFIGSEVGTGTPTSIYLLPPQNMLIKLKGVDNLNRLSLDFRELEIQEYALKLSETKTKPIPVEQILHLKAPNPNFDNGSFLFGQSSLVSAQYAINSIYAGYSAKVGLYKNGPKTVFSLNPPSGSEFGSFELPDTKDVEAEQKRMAKYGIEEGQWQNFISKLPITANQLSYNVRQLQINENNIRDFQVVCAAIGIDSRLLGDPSSATFANQEAAVKKFFQGVFMSGEKAFFHDLTTYMQTFKAWSNLIVEPDFSDIPELAESEKDLQEILLPEVEKGLLTRKFYLDKRGLDTEDLPDEFDEYATLNGNTWQPLAQDEIEGAES